MDDFIKLQEHIGFLSQLAARLSGGPKVLVVEDNPDDLTLLLRELEEFICQVETVHDGHEAVERMKTTKYDYILLDLSLPKLSGVEILQKTAGMRENANVILVTGHIDNEQVPTALKAGGVLAFAKPVTRVALRTIGLVPRTYE